MPADHHYDQVHQYILPELGKNRRVYFVVPHHGGHAGDYKLIKKIDLPGEAILSVGPNKWNHPYKFIRQTLKDVFDKDIFETASDHDYEKVLE
ncbi:hypothetical protein H7F15_12050 [Pontibacter sp. Tf4]|uniref:hypothetical protein n=1 Tax=Pontibacter sp. Tf4 TaxID=2761620 RepID=UPI0016297B78|nr:hypothetical protein [Pontibacter sp. Tf4]MBB6611774.1 hypothetical protein [Pontibacter sp. Tf4]